MNVDDVKDDENMEVSFPCLRARQPVGDIFIAAIPYKKLARITYFDVRRVLQDRRDVEKYLGIQRPVEPKRIDQLKEYVNLVDASFPSSVIIAFSDDYVSYDHQLNFLTIRNFRIGETSPSTSLGRTGRVIDGQHRIAGLEYFRGTEFDLSATIFVGADIADQAHLFATVNLEHTKVNKSLVYDLYELAKSRSPQKTCHNIVVTLDRDSTSPFYKRVKRLGMATEGRIFEPITQSTLVDGLMGYITDNPRRDRDQLLRGRQLEKFHGQDLITRPFRNLFVEGLDLKITQIVFNYFVAIRDKWPAAWDSREAGSMLNRTNGIRALLRFFRHAYGAVARPGEVVAPNIFLSKIFQSISLSDQDFTTENFVPGTSGESRLFRILRGEEELFPFGD